MILIDLPKHLPVTNNLLLSWLALKITNWNKERNLLRGLGKVMFLFWTSVCSSYASRKVKPKFPSWSVTSLTGSRFGLEIEYYISLILTNFQIPMVKLRQHTLMWGLVLPHNLEGQQSKPDRGIYWPTIQTRGQNLANSQTVLHKLSKHL